MRCPSCGFFPIPFPEKDVTSRGEVMQLYERKMVTLDEYLVLRKATHCVKVDSASPIRDAASILIPAPDAERAVKAWGKVRAAVGTATPGLVRLCAKTLADEGMAGLPCVVLRAIADALEEE